MMNVKAMALRPMVKKLLKMFSRFFCPSSLPCVRISNRTMTSSSPAKAKFLSSSSLTFAPRGIFFRAVCVSMLRPPQIIFSISLVSVRPSLRKNSPEMLPSFKSRMRSDMPISSGSSSEIRTIERPSAFSSSMS